MRVGFSAVMRRFPGGAFAKTAKSQAMPALPVHTKLENLFTYFHPWPKRQSQFLIYGTLRRMSTQVTPDVKSASDIERLYGGSNPTSKASQGTSANGSSVAGRSIGLAGCVKRFQNGEKLSMVTAYDYPSARFARAAGVEFVLVGDSVGNCRLGLPDTVGVTMEDMLRATSAVRRGIEVAPSIAVSSPKPLVIGDMPFGSYLIEAEALRNAANFRIAGAEMVKLEGGRYLSPIIRALTNAGIAVMGHIGLEPQRALLQGGLRLQGTTAEGALDIVRDAQALVDAGAVALVVECVPVEVGKAVQASVKVPVIGIGAGGYVAGQVLVCDDMMGVHGSPPFFAKLFADVGRATTVAYETYVSEVRSGTFPGESHARGMKSEEFDKLRRLLPEAFPEPKAAYTESVEMAPMAKNGVSLPYLNVSSSTNGSSINGAYPHEMAPGSRTFSITQRPTFAATALNGRSVRATVAAARNISQAATLSTETLQLLDSVDKMRAWRRDIPADRTVAFVPTMGNLHEGHLELVDIARSKADEVLVSIFVNPAQFAAHEDLDRYPRTFAEDIRKLQERGTSAVFTPTSADMYPNGSPGKTIVVPHFVDGKSEAAVRPTHFMGVATVCLKLFNLCQPDTVIFGQKDAMQCTVIARMLEDLMLDRISLVIAPTSREPDGLARSSRNAYLTPTMRAKAPAIYRALSEATVKSSMTAAEAKVQIKRSLESAGMEVSYISVADAYDMSEKADVENISKSVISVACVLEDNGVQCRLIDNVMIP